MRIAVLTVGRSDFGIYRPLLSALSNDARFEIGLIAGGMHLDSRFGQTIDEVRASGYRISAELKDPPEHETASVAELMAWNLAGFTKVLRKAPLDLVIVLGDRYEMFAGAAAATSLNLPLAHFHGGEVTLGAIDDVFRHSITKMSHLHFTSTSKYERRVIQMGEEPWRVHTVGALAIDNIKSLDLPGKEQLAEIVGMGLDEAPILATLHPTTRDPSELKKQTENFLAALRETGLPVILTAPNADEGGALILNEIRYAVAQMSDWRLVRNLGIAAYFGLMREARLMAGNSSSGILEAASFGLPVVNVGSRQEGRVSGRNVLHCGWGLDELQDALRRGMDPDFKSSLLGMRNPYGSGETAERVRTILADPPPREVLLRKTFYDLADPI